MIKSFKFRFLILTLATLSASLAVSCKKNSETESKQEDEVKTHRIVSLHGALTEMVAALGYEDQLVGVDVTSTFPESIKGTAKDLGHVRSITIESILELQPTLILAMERDLNSDLKEKIVTSGIEAYFYQQKYALSATKNLIREIAGVLGSDKEEALIRQIDEDYSQVVRLDPKPKVLFIYARGAGTLMVSGKNTPMQSIIELAGGTYSITEFDDFKPLTPESLIDSNPDVILLFDSGLESLGGIEGLLQVPGVATTNAGKNKKIISMEGGFLSGFGPRVGKAAAQLNVLLKSE